MNNNRESLDIGIQRYSTNSLDIGIQRYSTNSTAK